MKPVKHKQSLMESGVRGEGGVLAKNIYIYRQARLGIIAPSPPPTPRRFACEPVAVQWSYTYTSIGTSINICRVPLAVARLP
jgi:hypothetical protein